METAVGERNQEDIQRWKSKPKAALVLSLLNRETSIQEAARQHGLTLAEGAVSTERRCLKGCRSTRGGLSGLL